METYLAPVEKPEGLIMKLVYYFTKKQFGKVLTPLKIHSVRLPLAFGQFYGKISQLDKKMILSAETAMLIRQQVARVNICLFCIDIARYVSLQEKMSQAKLEALDKYATSPLFTTAERAALNYATELTQTKKVEPNTFAELAKHYTEREICEIVWLVASEHVYNITNIGLNIHSDMLCDISKRN